MKNKHFWRFVLAICSLILVIALALIGTVFILQLPGEITLKGKLFGCSCTMIGGGALFYLLFCLFKSTLIQFMEYFAKFIPLFIFAPVLSYVLWIYLPTALQNGSGTPMAPEDYLKEIDAIRKLLESADDRMLDRDMDRVFGLNPGHLTEFQKRDLVLTLARSSTEAQRLELISLMESKNG